MTTSRPARSAVVVGCCAHGLAVVRSLARSGIDVHILEADQGLPGLRSRYGTQHIVHDINGPGLIPSLLKVRESFDADPVLFLTNDRMIRLVAGHISTVSSAYRLSWARSAEYVSRLTGKDVLEEHCRRRGLLYPKAFVVECLSDLRSLTDTIKWPQIVKPIRPLSSFKAECFDDLNTTTSFLSSRERGFPILFQQWIPGDESRIHFCALYLDSEAPLARFDGRKLRSFPMGHTTIAERFGNEAVFESAVSFFRGTGVSGPVSLEMKADDEGRYWVIEPTVGRTDFWLDLCISNGVNLPVIEYAHQAGEVGTGSISPMLSREVVWMNAERDPPALVWYPRHIRPLSRLLRPIRFTYLDFSDPKPLFVALARLVGEKRTALAKRVANLLPVLCSRQRRT